MICREKCKYLESGLMVTDSDGKLLAVLFDDALAMEGLSTDNFIDEILVPIGIKVNDLGILESEDELVTKMNDFKYGF